MGHNAADTSTPNMEIVTVPAETNAFDAAVGESPKEVIYLPENGYTILDQPALAITAGGDPIRIVWEFPPPMDDNDCLYKVIATISCPTITYPGQLVIFPTRVVLFNLGLTLPPESEAWDARMTGFKPRSRVKYIYEFSAPDVDHLDVTVWDEGGGAPVGSCSIEITGVFDSQDGTIVIGWPAHSQVVQLEAQIASEEGVVNPRGTPVRPYLVKVHEIGAGNLGPTAVSVSPASAVSATLIEGTVIGTFSTTHATETGSFNYTLVSGTGDTDNASFTIVGTTLKAATPLAAATYSIRVQTKDRFGLVFADALTITIV